MIRLDNKNRLIQLAEYLFGGGLWFVSGYIIFAICYSILGWTWWQAKLLADVVGLTLNYMVQRYLTFNTKKLYKHEGQNRGRYILLSGINIVLDYLIVGALHAVGITPYIGMFVAAGVFTVWNYFWYRWWVFKPQ